MSDLRPGTTMHRIAELERVTRELRQDRRELRALLELAEQRITALEALTLQARQLQMEADLAAADLAESGYDRHGRGCDCPECYEPEPEEYDPGPEADDEGGMSEYRHVLPGEEF
jgi:hypothetical protein